MKLLSLGKLRGLQELSNDQGLLTVLALDQRGSLISALGLEESDPLLYTRVRDIKLQIIEHLLPNCSAILLDPQFSAAEAMTGGLVSGQKGLIVAIEESGYIEKPDGRINQIIKGWSLGKAKRMGASAAKLLAYYNPRIEDLAATQRLFIQKLVAESDAVDIPLLLEPMSYSNDPRMSKNSSEFAQIRTDIVLETVKDLGSLGVDLLKLEFPCDVNYVTDRGVWAEACAKITDISPVPWLLLSAGVDYSVFKNQLEVACLAGASGFVAGRAIWKEAVQLEGAEREEFLKNVAVRRVNELSEIVYKTGTPWQSKLQDRLPVIDQNWFQSYQGLG